MKIEHLLAASKPYRAWDEKQAVRGIVRFVTVENESEVHSILQSQDLQAELVIRCATYIGSRLSQARNARATPAPNTVAIVGHPWPRSKQ